MNNRNTKEKEYHSFETPYTVSITIQGKKKPPGHRGRRVFWKKQT